MRGTVLYEKISSTVVVSYGTPHPCDVVGHHTDFNPVAHRGSGGLRPGDNGAVDIANNQP